MRKITADKIFTGLGEVLGSKVIVLDDNGYILSIDALENHDPASIQTFKGTLIPGYINTHCHLELSHLKGLIPTGTGLVPFISRVVKYRDFPMEEVLDAIGKADAEMWENGIMAVGDICNKIDTAATKEKSQIAYYSFVEMFDFLQESMTNHFFNQFIEAYDGQADSGKNRKSIVPHAPYSVSPALFEKINGINGNTRKTISIHNQECHDENQLFQNKGGALPEFYQSMGFGLDDFQPTMTPSINYALQYLDPKINTLFIHNTICTKEDIRNAHEWSPNTYWATCANANLYIENKLPNYQLFIDDKAKMTIGTDSLSSNWQLSIWEEIKTIKKYNSYIDLKELLTWATYNGAEALDYHHILGSISIGKKPGINLLSVILGELDHDLTQATSVKIF